MMQSSGSTFQRVRPLLILAGALTILISVVRWGGSARGGPLFWAGVAVLAGLIFGLSALIWWLYLSPIADDESIPRRGSAAMHQFVATLALISSSLFIFGGFWDELWHRQFGGFGNDFLWPPHLMLYASVTIFALFAIGGLLLTMRGAGSIRQRFRAEPLIGLLGLAALYLMISLPSDELWHRIYGKDLTAWSLPHLILGGGVALVTLVAVGLQMSLIPASGWRGPRGIRWREIQALLLLTMAMMILIQLGTTEWDGLEQIRSGAVDAFRDAFWQRPVWLFPVVVITLALFVGTFALHALRRAGAATAVALLVFGLRALILAIASPAAQANHMGVTAHLLMIAPMVALDMWYALRLRHADSLLTLIGGNLWAGGVFLAIGLPLIAARMAFPPVTSATIPGMIAMTLIMALVAGWAGARMGGWLGALDRQPGEVAVPRRAIWASLGSLAAALAIVALILLTAQPPVA